MCCQGGVPTRPSGVSFTTNSFYSSSLTSSFESCSVCGMKTRRLNGVTWAISLCVCAAGCLEADEDTPPVTPEAMLKTRQTVVSQGIRDKVIVGYQGWFTAYGDGSPTERWSHWSAGVYRSNQGVPAPGHQSFDLYPDISEYAPGSLFQTGYAPLGNGTPAKLFSSYPADVVNKHFQWMQQYGIDGAAVQRFLTTDGVFMAHRDSVASKVKTAAEATGRLFYIMYDVSGLSDATFLQMVKEDWTNRIVGQLHLPSSARYATQDGKPVVAIWGLGFTDRPGSAAQA
jgi:hypothetical protein